MKRSDITDAQVCEAYRRWRAECPYGKTAEVHLMEMTGAPIKVAYAAMERASDRDLVNYGVSLRTGWLTEKGLALLETVARDHVPTL